MCIYNTVYCSSQVTTTNLHQSSLSYSQFPKMGTESKLIMVDEFPFPSHLTSKSLPLMGHGITDMEIHFLQIKFTAIGVYLDPEIISYLQTWKGRAAADLAEDDRFFDALISAPIEKVVRVVVIKEIKGSQYGAQIESAVRDRLAAEDKFEEEEEEQLEKILEFLQSKYLKTGSVLTFWFSAEAESHAEIGFADGEEGKEMAKMEVKNGNVVEAIQKWYLGGTHAVSGPTVSSLATTLSTHLLK